MALTRRGFLQIMGVALGTAAVFDPKSMLWVPETKAIAAALDAPFKGLTGSAAEAAVKRIAEQQLELNDLAMLVAHQMTDRLERSRAVLLHQIMFREAGHVRLANQLDVDQLGRGYFVPAPSRVAWTNEFDRNANRPYVVDAMAKELAYEIGRRRCDMFAPISSELRPGEPFTGDIAAGVGTDPSSGLSVRVVRFEIEPNGRHYQRTLHTVEMAGGEWEPAGARARRAKQRSWQYQYGED